MYNRKQVVLTTMEEDFRNIGLLPEEELSEESHELSEVDDPKGPRDVPSPDPNTLPGLDDRWGSKAGRHKYAKQPKPALSPEDYDDHDDPDEAGSTQDKPAERRFGKRGRSGDGHEQGLEKNTKYDVLKKRILGKPKGVYQDDGEDPEVAQGLSVTSRIGGMRQESRYTATASELLNEVNEILKGAQASEDLDSLREGFALVAENAALLADRLEDIHEHYDVEGAIQEMEELAENAIDAYEITEMQISKEDDIKKSIKKGFRQAEEVEEELQEGVEVTENLKEVFKDFTLNLMDVVEAYDGTISEMAEEDEEELEGYEDEDEYEEDHQYAGRVSEKLAELRALRDGGSKNA